MRMRNSLKKINIFIGIIILILSGSLLYAGSPQIISENIAPASPGWGQQFILTLQMCVDQYSTPNELLVAVSTSSTFQPAQTGGQIFLISSDGINIPDTNPNNGSSGTDFGYHMPQPSPFVANCTDCGSGSGMLVTESYNLTMPSAQQMGTACGSTTLNLLIGAQTSYFGGSLWTALSNGACSTSGSGAVLSWSLPTPPANSVTLDKRVEGVLQSVGDLVLFSIDYTYGNGSLTITDALPGGGSLALVSVGPSSINSGSVSAPAAGSTSGTVTWTFPASTYTKQGTVWILMRMTTAMASGTSVPNTANATSGSTNASASATLIVGQAAISVEKLESVTTFMKATNATVTISYYLNYQVNGDKLQDYRAFDDTATGTYGNSGPPSGWKLLPFTSGDNGTWTIGDPCNTGDRILTGAGQTASYPALLLDDPTPSNVQVCTGIIESDIYINPGTYPGADGLVILRSNGQSGGNAEAYSLLLSIDTAPAGGFMAIQKCAGSSCTWNGASSSVTITGDTWYRTKTWMTTNGSDYIFQAKVWQVGQPEPTGYQVTWTDTGAASNAAWNCSGTGTYTDWRPGVGQQSGDYGTTQDSYNNFAVLIPRVAANATLYDTVPTGLTYQGSNPSGTDSGGIVSWSLGNISDQSGSYTWWASTNACAQSFTNVGGIGATNIVSEFSNPVVFNIICMSPTFTATPTRTPTPTVNPNTPTFTYTPTFTPTYTFTRTDTPTSTFTYTDTPSPTYTKTPTPTDTYTNTATYTYTYTFTYTVTYTPTFTRTDTPSQTPTYTNTFTPTNTNTPSPTPTFTRTNTQTYTYTQTVTYTYTDTITVTPTPTFTLTVTNTVSVTDTRTDTPTFTQTQTPTPTPTFTNTLSPTSTYTRTVTYTYTYTITVTPTPTFTLTVTNTVSVTDTRTYTPTYTQTATPTPTSTFTNTLSPTYTYTQTPTFTRTYTPTATPTYTNTQSPTPTYTQTVTYTFTYTATKTYTPTVTNTVTPTYTITMTFTVVILSATYTPTFTITQTSTPTYTVTVTDTKTYTPTNTPTYTNTASPTPTYTQTVTYTYTFTDTMTVTPSPSPTMTITVSVTFTRTYTPTFTLTDTPTPTPTYTNTASPTPTYTRTVTYTSTATPTPTDTVTPTYTITMTFTVVIVSATITPTYTVTKTITVTDTQTYTPTSTPTYTNTTSPTPTYTQTVTYTSTNTASYTNTVTPTYTITMTFTVVILSATFTPTYTATRTITVTDTQTDTPTATPTYTNTTSPTPTYTQTVTDTSTATGTYTDTVSPTYTITMTFTVVILSATYTPTYTATRTITVTDTQTDTPTATPTYTNTTSPTFTYTQTVTDTSTATPSYTNTDTPTCTITMTFTVVILSATFTPTYTVTKTTTLTYTQTDTPSDTPTYTYTSTETDTGTPTYTYTATPTATATDTATPTYTNSPVDTPTDTPTVSPTPSSTPTDTSTYTNTPTDTPTFTPTVSITSSSTLTLTYTYTLTSTYTDTPVDTPTYTSTSTPTYTSTLTQTYTYTDTITATMTWTNTRTLTTTNTATNTLSATITYTSTNTQTVTITITPVPFPYVMNISVYNEAGELVKTIVSTTTSQEAQQVQLLLNGNQATVVAPGSGTPLTIKVPGLETPDQQKNGYASFTWDGTNSAGQDVTNGTYYIKETTTDPYGHSDIITKQITAINEDQYVQVNIFNSAGELVQTITAPYNGSGQVSLSISNSTGSNNYVFGIGKGAPAIVIGYTTTGLNVPWDGKNAQGNYLQSGVYEVQLVVKTNQGISIKASKSITLLNEGNTDVLGTIKSLPNPYIGDTSTPLIFTWQPSANGAIKIKIYNIAGELVRTLVGDLGAASINWDLKSVGGQTVSSGTYICVVEGVDTIGNKTRKIVKLSAIIQSGQ